MNIKDIIIETVSSHQGIKATELVVEVMQQIDIPTRQVFERDEYDKSLVELIENGEIIEVEYTLPHMDYRVKSLYFPKDTVIEISKAS